MPDHALSAYPPVSRLLRVREVAAMLAVSTPTVWRLVRAGELRAVRVGGSTRFLQSDVESLIEHGKHVSHRAEKDEDPAARPGPVEAPAGQGRHAAR
jgi:excisionase family DNA binding protein